MCVSSMAVQMNNKNTLIYVIDLWSYFIVTPCGHSGSQQFAYDHQQTGLCAYIQFKYAHTLSHTYTQVMEQLLRFSIQPVLSTESSQYERLGGLYLAYTLHSSQPCQQPQAVVGDYNLY